MVVFPSYGICAFWNLVESCPMATGGVYTVYPIFRRTHFMIRKTCIFDAFYSLNLVQTSQEPTGPHWSPPRCPYMRIDRPHLKVPINVPSQQSDPVKGIYDILDMSCL